MPFPQNQIAEMHGGGVPLGYRVDPDRKGYLLVVPEEVNIVRNAFQFFVKERTISETAKWLNANGYRYRASRSGGGGKNRLGFFTFNNLDRILRNKAYVGVKTYLTQGRPMEAKAVWEPVLDESTFQKAQEILNRVYDGPKPLGTGDLCVVSS